MRSINKLLIIVLTMMFISTILAQKQNASGQESANRNRTDSLNAVSTTGNGISFVQPTGSPVSAGNNPQSVTTADFNLDGKADLAIANEDANNVTIQLGGGNGNFHQAPGSPVNVGNAPVFIVAGNFNQDARPDLAVANIDSNNVTILLGLGNGSFTPLSPIAVGTAPLSIAVADFNQDGKADLAVANTDSNNLTILSGNGMGGFTQAAGSPIAVGMAPITVVAHDFNRDDRPDLAVTNLDSNNVTVLLNSAKGSFIPAPGSPIAVGTFPADIDVGDFNQDGKADLTVTNSYSEDVSVLLGTGNGSFTNAPDSPVVVGIEATAIALADWNLDGKADLLIGSNDDQTMKVFAGNGSGGFMEFAGSPFLVARRCNDIAVGDFNLDGKADFATVQDELNIASIYLNTSLAFPCEMPSFSRAAGAPIAIGTRPTSIVSGDFNRDGQQDMAISNRDSDNISILLGNGTGGFTPAIGSPIAAGSLPGNMAVGDFNLDNQLDLVVVGAFSGGITILLGNGNGGFVAAGAPIIVTDTPSAVGVADINLDGKPDLALAGQSKATTLLGNGSGGFTQAGAPVNVGMLPIALAMADFNLDGKIDIAVANTTSADITILLGNGSGGFTQPNPAIPVGGFSNSIAISDFNLDGKVDLVVAINRNSDNIVVLLGNGNGSFIQEANSPYSVGAFPSSVVAGDFNLDGRPDLAGASTFTGNVAILLANPGGGFKNVLAVAGGDQPASMVVNDFNQDGRPDWAVANSNSNDVNIQLNTCAGTECVNAGFASRNNRDRTVGTSPVSIAVADFNLDNKADMAVANFGSNDVTIEVNTGDGILQMPAPPIAVGTNPSYIAAGDFNQDAVPDLAVANQGSNNVTVLLGNGVSGFTPTGAPVAVGVLPQAIVVADFNQDGKGDFAVANQNSNNVMIFLGNGSGGFAQAPNSPITVGTNPSHLAVGDFDLDAAPDLAVTNLGSNTVTVLLNRSFGDFGITPASSFPTGTNPRSVAVGDFNQDRKPDLAVVNFNSNNVTVLLGNGTGGFTPTGSPVSVGLNPRSIVAHDFNKDGSTDLIVTNLNFNTYSVLICNGNGGFIPTSTQFAAPNAPAFVTAGDFDLDGKTDIAIAGFGVNALVLRFNTCISATPPMIICPQNIVISANPNQCSASVSFNVTATGAPAPIVVCKLGATVITSPHTFPVGASTVSCTASNGTMPDATCSFTVTVQDTQPPTISCPANITAVTNQSVCVPSGQTPCQVISFPAPVVSDNCSGATVVCNPASGSCFPIGTTTVTCTASDSSGNTASCSFAVTVFDACLQDDNNPGTVLLFNSFTGDYRFCCNGTTFTGKGTVSKLGCNYTLEHNAADRRVLGKVDKGLFRGNGSLQVPSGSLKCSISDRDTRNNACTCQ
jgi:hypothetical protein